MTSDTDVARSGGRLWQGLSLRQKQVVWAWTFLAVPILFYGPRWVKPGMRSDRVEVSGIAPTLAGMLRVAPPSTSEGKVLPVAAGAN